MDRSAATTTVATTINRDQNFHSKFYKHQVTRSIEFVTFVSFPRSCALAWRAFLRIRRIKSKYFSFLHKQNENKNKHFILWIFHWANPLDSFHKIKINSDAMAFFCNACAAVVCQSEYDCILPVHFGSASTAFRHTIRRNAVKSTRIHTIMQKTFALDTYKGNCWLLYVQYPPKHQVAIWSMYEREPNFAMFSTVFCSFRVNQWNVSVAMYFICMKFNARNVECYTSIIRMENSNSCCLHESHTHAQPYAFRLKQRNTRYTLRSWRT